MTSPCTCSESSSVTSRCGGTAGGRAPPREKISTPGSTASTSSGWRRRGGTWQVIRAAAGWELIPAPQARPAACQARTTVNGALKLYARDPSAPLLTWQGDREIADALAGVKAVLG